MPLSKLPTSVASASASIILKLLNLSPIRRAASVTFTDPVNTNMANGAVIFRYYRLLPNISFSPPDSGAGKLRPNPFSPGKPNSPPIPPIIPLSPRE